MPHGALAEIIKLELGEEPVSIEKLTGGISHAVHAVTLSNRSVVIRMKANHLEVFRKEQWVMEQAERAGIPVPPLVAIGQHEAGSYMISGKIEGTRGDLYQGDLPTLYAPLGDYARRLNSIPVRGYGFSFTATPEPHFLDSWEGVRTWDEQFIFDSNTLTRLGVLTGDEQSRLQQFVEPMASWTHPPFLSHNDISLDNVVVCDDGKVYLLDWTLAQELPAPYFEIGNFASWSSQRRHLGPFLEGYGISSAQWLHIRDDVDRVSLLNTLRGTVWAEAEAPQQLDLLAENARRMVDAILDPSARHDTNGQPA